MHDAKDRRGGQRETVAALALKKIKKKPPGTGGAEACSLGTGGKSSFGTGQGTSGWGSMNIPNQEKPVYGKGAGRRSGITRRPGATP